MYLVRDCNMARFSTMVSKSSSLNEAAEALAAAAAAAGVDFEGGAGGSGTVAVAAPPDAPVPVGGRPSTILSSHFSSFAELTSDNLVSELHSPARVLSFGLFSAGDLNENEV
jgi:hypothetical protein